MNNCKDSFILGISKKADELSLPTYLKDQVMKFANVLWTNDTIENVAGNGPNVGDNNGPSLLSLMSSHAGKAGLAGAGLGGAIGGGIGHNLSNKENKTKNTLIGSGVGALLGGTSGAFNDLYRLVDNSRTEEIKRIHEQINSGLIPEELGSKQLIDIENTPWYKYYGL